MWTDFSDEQSAFDGLWKTIIFSFISFLRFQLNEFLQLEIKQKLSSVQKITYITAIADKKIISLFCVSRVLCSPSQSAAQVKQFPQYGSNFSTNPQHKRKKTNHHLYKN